MSVPARIWPAVFGWLALACGGAEAEPPALPNAAEPLPGITTSGQPDAASIEALAERGYAAVIDLRTPEEERGFDEKRTVEQHGMKYVSLPIAGEAGVSYDNASTLDEILSGIDGPVLLHCSSGNRAGALLALRAKLRGRSNEEALTLGAAAGLTTLRPVVEARLAEQ